MYRLLPPLKTLVFLGEPQNMAETSKQEGMRLLNEDEQGHGRASERKADKNDASVVMDMEGLSLLVDHAVNADRPAETDSTAAPRFPMFSQKTLFRKAAADGGTIRPTTPAVNASSREDAAAACPPEAAAPDKFFSVVFEPAPAPAVIASHFATSSPRKAAPCRRAHTGRGAATSPYLNPRRVLLLFATLSSMGTLLLLYFMLSMGKMGDGDADAR